VYLTYLRRALVVGLIAVAGILVGHFVWGVSSTSRSATSSTLLGPFGASPRYRASRPTAGSGGDGGGASGSGGQLFGPGGEASESGSAGAAAGSGSSDSSGEVSSSITSKVDPALVDIDTDLGLEDGEAAGTGIVVTSTGEVFTNNHVIDGATTIHATDIGNGKTYTARVVGYDRSQDIAVLQLEGASGLTTASIGDSSSLQAGQSVTTIGNAGGVGGTPSAASGQITALDQSITASDEVDGTQEQLSGLIQINGDLQPGDSGGSLVNASGEVLGMDTAASTTFQIESSADEGFAIPISQVQTIAAEILDGRSSSTIHVGTTGFLGVLVDSRSSDGALVDEALSGTPAAGSGLSAGDVITALDGTSVSSPTALTDAILQEHPGDSVRVTWQTQAGTQQSATVKLASGPPQ
jgi:S1-C subfamily serine protease